jgi:hypothetical protein
MQPHDQLAQTFCRVCRKAETTTKFGNLARPALTFGVYEQAL